VIYRKGLEMSGIGTVCVYCGSSGKGRESHRAAAVAFGRLLADAGIRLVYGGGQVGLMGLLANSAIDSGGTVIGIIPHFLDELEVGNTRCTELIRTPNMHERKSKMAELSDAFVILPGGLGTLDETFEILTWRQLDLHDKPIVVVDVEGYWAPLRAMVTHMADEKYIAPEHLDLLTFVDSVEEVIATLNQAPPPTHPIDSKWT